MEEKIAHKKEKIIMSLLPDKNLFIVTSALNPNIGVISVQDRFTQTIQTLQNLKHKVPDSLILLVDGSPNAVNDDMKMEINQYCPSIWFNNHTDIHANASIGRKSEAEIILIFNVLAMFKTNLQMMKILHSVKRIFKYSARSILTDDFNIKDYDGMFGKYVFKKSIPSWMDDKKKTNVTDHLYITRMYSFCPSLLDNYLQTLQPILNNVIQHGIDTEHSHYLCLDKKYIFEFDNINCQGIIGSTGLIERY